MTVIPNGVFVTGTDTGIGKTLVSGILAVGWNADYWKPVQSGLEDGTDSDTMANWIDPGRIHPERYRLNRPLSPNQAAGYDGVSLDLADFECPKTDKPLIVEGAGGLRVPLNDTHEMIDLIDHLKLPVILAARSSLGTLNHTLLSIEALQRRGLELIGVIFSGDPHPDNARDIAHFGKTRILGTIPVLAEPESADLAEIYRAHLTI